MTEGRPQFYVFVNVSS